MTEPDDAPLTPEVLGAGADDHDDLDDLDDGDTADVDPFAALLGGGSGGLDFGAILEQAGQVQAQLMAAQQQAAATEVEGVAGGGAVRISVTGGFEFRSVTISPDAVDPDDVEMLEDLVLAALRDAAEQAAALQQGGIDLGGMDLGGLFGGS